MRMQVFLQPIITDINLKFGMEKKNLINADKLCLKSCNNPAPVHSANEMNEKKIFAINGTKEATGMSWN